VISAAENSNKFQKIRFWKEKSIENVVPLGPTAQATLVNERSSHSLIFPPTFHSLMASSQFKPPKTVKIANVEGKGLFWECGSLMRQEPRMRPEFPEQPP